MRDREEQSRTPWPIAGYYVLLAVLLAARLATRRGPDGWQWLGPSGWTVLEWLLWISLISLPPLYWMVGLEPRRRARLLSRLVERLRAPVAPLTVFLVYELTVVLLLGSRLFGAVGAELEILEVAFWMLLLFLPAIIPYVASLSLSLPGPGGSNVKLELKRLQERIEEEKRRIDRMTYDAERVIHSLTSLVFTPEERVRFDVSERLRRRRTVIVGCADFTEQRLLCAMLAELLHHHTPFDHVIPEFDLGGAARNFVALARGATDVLPAYTWTGFELLYPTLLPEQEQRAEWLSFSARDQTRELNRVFSERPHPLTWTTLLGYHSDWRMVMRRRDVEKMGIPVDNAALSDVEPWSERLTLGCEPDFYYRRNGLGVLQGESCYGLRFKEIVLCDHREAYNLLRDGEVDIIDGFTTDPDLQGKDFLTLEDDKGLFGTYHASLVTSTEFLETCQMECPDIEKILGLLRFREDELEGEETSQERWNRELGRMVRIADDSRSHHIDTVKSQARRFLRQRGLV